ncbi:hypothetical protein LTR51_008665 [Lithohypha guttulata]|nr:hypothetical protein LTR51_008665 [Lithohypha guttulata]
MSYPTPSKDRRKLLPMAPAALPDRVPSPCALDVHMQQMTLPNFVLGLPPHVVARQITLSRPTYEQRLVEIIREKGSLTRELGFFRAVYQAMEAMQDALRAIVQDLTLNYYIRPNERGETDMAWLQVTDELSIALQRLATVTNGAVQDWMELEWRQQEHDQGSWL